MLQRESTKKLNELNKSFTHRWVEVDLIQKTIKLFKISHLLKSFAYIKQKGYSFELVLTMLIMRSFYGEQSIHSLVKHKFDMMKKDVYYRFLNDEWIDWRSILLQFVLKFILLVKKQRAKDKADNDKKRESPKCLVLDDTDLGKTGKFIEGVSKIWSHVVGRHILGFKLNVLTYFDGFSTLVVDFTLHRERGKNQKMKYGLKPKKYKKQYRKKRAKNSPGYTRKKELDESKIDSGLRMFYKAIKSGLKADYLLLDSWFTNNAFIDAVRSVKGQTIHLIGMYKMVKTKFLYKGKMLTFREIRRRLGKPKRNKRTGYYYLEANVELDGKPVKLFFSRKGKRGDWKTFLTTDMKLNFGEMIKIYQIRWTIEIFFKEAKQLLGLGRSQSNDFDAQIASITIVAIQYNLLMLRLRYEEYESMGRIFREAKVEVLRLSLSERLWGLLQEIISVLVELIGDKFDEDETLERMINDEKVYQKVEKLLNTA